MTPQTLLQAQTVTIRVRNHRGEISDRSILPQAIRFASTEWHQKEQWILDAWDYSRGAERSFAVADILAWTPAEGHP